MDGMDVMNELDTMERKLAAWTGRFIEVRIVDMAGEDPVAPPRVEMLHHAVLMEDGSLLQLYFKPQQFLSVPLFERTLTSCTDKLLRSEDKHANLVYEVRLI
jgi:hypothetical protein